jgi:death-on-curing protein
MGEPRWLSLEAVLILHEKSLERFGGAGGVRDRGLLESAMGRPQNKFLYKPETSPHALAAAYCFGIARNHPFFDGNKRTAFAAMGVFLELNGLILEVDTDAAEQMVLAVASGEMSEAALEVWLLARCG